MSRPGTKRALPDAQEVEEPRLLIGEDSDDEANRAAREEEEERRTLEARLMSGTKILDPRQSVKPICDFVRENSRPIFDALRQHCEKTIADGDDAEVEHDVEMPVVGRSLTLQRGGTYGASSVPPSAKVESLHAGLPPTDPAALSLELLNVQMMSLSTYFESRYMLHCTKAQTEPENRARHEVHEAGPAHVAEMSTAAYPPFEACTSGRYCVGYELDHPRGSFAFIRYVKPTAWTEWQRTGRPPQTVDDFCYWCQLRMFSYVRDRHLRASNANAACAAPFYSPINRPGAYRASAVYSSASGHTGGSARPLRYFSKQQLVPSMKRVRTIRRSSTDARPQVTEENVPAWRENDSVLYFAPEPAPRAEPPLLRPSRPPSYTVTEFTAGGPPTAESVLRHELMDPDASTRQPQLGARVALELRRAPGEPVEAPERSSNKGRAPESITAGLAAAAAAARLQERQAILDLLQLPDGGTTVHPKGQRGSAS